MKDVLIQAVDGYSLSVHIFEISDPAGYVQVIHGMEEHQERYEDLASALNRVGYAVITSNMRGHGSNAPVLGYFAPRYGWQALLEDQKAVTAFIRANYNPDRINIFAHSMGTVIARNLMQTESTHYEKVILSGPPCPNPAAGLAVFLANIVQAFYGAQYDSSFLKWLAVGAFNRSVDHPRTDVDWISVNAANVEQYRQDPLCGHGFKASAYNDLFHLVWRMGKPKYYRAVNSELPILLLRGDSDPCTGYDRGTTDSIEVLKKAGFSSVRQIKYQCGYPF